MASDPILTQLNQMVTAMKARMTPTELKAHEAFSLLSWDEKMTVLQTNQRAIEQALGQQQATPPTPQQEATQLATQQKNRKRNKKTRQQYKRKALQQTNVENIAEKLSDSSPSSKVITVNNTNLLSIIPRHTATSMHREVFIRLDKTLIHLLASRLTSRLASRLTFLCQHDWPLPYIRQAEDMEATGQG